MEALVRGKIPTRKHCLEPLAGPVHIYGGAGGPQTKWVRILLNLFDAIMKPPTGVLNTFQKNEDSGLKSRRPRLLSPIFTSLIDEHSLPNGDAT